MFRLEGFICGSVNAKLLTRQPISFGGVHFLDDRSGNCNPDYSRFFGGRPSKRAAG